MLASPALSFEKLSIPVIAAPMFLASSFESVVAACRSGIVGSYPALNQRTTEGLDDWLNAVEAALTEGPFPGVEYLGPLSVNLVTHGSNERLEADLEVIIKHKVPVVVTSLGANPDIIKAIHSYGGLVYHDVISIKHAKKAINAGVDGIIAVSAGAGGHGGTLNPFPFVQEVRAMTDKTIILAGALSTGRQVAAAMVAGADLVSIGTRFIAIKEAPVKELYKDMIIESNVSDIVYTPKLSGIHANFLALSLKEAGIDLEQLDVPDGVQFGGENRSSDRVHTGDAKVYVDIWSAGQGVGAITTVPAMVDLVSEMRDEFHQAISEAFSRYGVAK